ncbi:MAG: HNH endonuclease [Thermoplasmataceae archaeon]
MEEKIETCFAIFRKAIPKILSSGGMSTAKLYSQIEKTIPECTSSEIFYAKGKAYGLKWEHTVREAQQYLKRLKIIELVEGKWESKIYEEVNDELEQEEIISMFRKENVEKLELESVQPNSPEFVTINGIKYKRDNVTIGKLKIVRGNRCQICGEAILKKDGSLYVEGAHITAKRDKGPETPDNILILCPNHHKEFDYGKRERLERTKDKVKFMLNGVNYSIDISL